MSTQYIDATPSWEGILPYLIVIMQDGTHEGQKLAREELRRMARLADAAARIQREAA